MRRLLLVPVLVLAATAALAAPAGAGNQWVSVGGGVSVVLPAGWHVVRGRTSYVVDPFPAHTPRFRIGHSAIPGACAPSDGRTFREGGRGFQVEIYLGPDAPASVRAQIAAILNSWQVAPPGRVSPEAS